MSDSADSSEAKPVEVPAGPITDVRLEVPEPVDESAIQGSNTREEDVVIIIVPEPEEKSDRGE